MNSYNILSNTQKYLSKVLFKKRKNPGSLLTEYNPEKVYNMFKRDGQIEGTIEVYKEFNFSKEQALNKIMNKYNLSYYDAVSYIDSFWKD